MNQNQIGFDLITGFNLN